jgi:D-cysteine desulfhydrase
MINRNLQYLIIIYFRFFLSCCMQSSRTSLSQAAYFGSMTSPPRTIFKYHPPEWAVPYFPSTTFLSRLKLAHVPTPLYNPFGFITNKDQVSNSSPLQLFLEYQRNYNITFLVKRDDMTSGIELGGNKVRKLEFLLADAISQGCNSIVTIGGIQSNHCRATACAARSLGMEPHIILRTTAQPNHSTTSQPSDSIGWTGNLLLDRMVGSQIYTCTPGEYGRVGSDALVQRLAHYLKFKHHLKKKVYPIPVGGSNALGTWGYIDAIHELQQQLSFVNTQDPHMATSRIDHIVVACGSGGTATGITLGANLCPSLRPLENQHISSSSTTKSSPPQVHAVAVCDTPDYFYEHMTKIAQEMGFQPPDGRTVDQWMSSAVTIHSGKGLGYAKSTPDELKFCTEFAQTTGILLDPVYTGKALYYFLTNVVMANVEDYRDSTILFWHTGGALGMFDKCDALDDGLNSIHRLDVYNRNRDDMISI